MIEVKEDIDLELLENFKFEKRYNRNTGNLEKYVYKVSKTSSIKVNIDTRELEVQCGFINSKNINNMNIILKLIELYENRIIKINYKEECR